jgi:uncharacterized protein YecE (DUF72 family)
MADRLYVGTSGWAYPEWKEALYAEAPRKEWLRVYARSFRAVEVNATFYHLQARATFDAWREQTPPRFRFAIKGNRFLTHRRRLEDPGGSIAIEKQRASALGDKLAVVLWQMPAKLEPDLGRLRAFARALGAWPEARHALEFRSQALFTDQVAECLAAQRLAACISDAADWPRWDAVTTDLVYLRLHGHQATYASSYTDAELRGWAERARGWLAEGREVHIYLDNTSEGAAPRNARRILEMLASTADAGPGPAEHS